MLIKFHDNELRYVVSYCGVIPLEPAILFAKLESAGKFRSRNSVASSIKENINVFTIQSMRLRGDYVDPQSPRKYNLDTFYM
jgi:hypothetical protein